ncbi:phosphopantetheine-binding protein [Streptomyces sp. CO7]
MSEAQGRLVRVVAEAWQEVLGIDGVGPDDDFFDLGGDSMVAARLSMLLEERLGSGVELLTVFDHPTVAELAAELEKTHADRV